VGVSVRYYREIAVAAAVLVCGYLWPVGGGVAVAIFAAASPRRLQLHSEYEAALASSKEIMARADRAGREMTSDERNQVQGYLDKAKGIKRQMDRLDGDSEMLAAIEGLAGGRELLAGGGGVRGSLGSQFIRSDVFRWLQENKGKLPQQWSSPAGELSIGASTLTEDAASGGDLVLPDYRPGITPIPQRRVWMEQLFAPGSTTSNAVTTMRETTFTNAAAPTAEGTDKPESALVFDAQTDGVVKIPHWIPVTEEMLEDVPALRAYIDARLRLGVNLATDDQLLNGDGSSPNMKGILAASRTLATAVARGTDTNADAILKQIAAIESDTEVSVDGIVLNPTNWLTIQLQKKGDGDYYSGTGPFAQPRTPMLWGRPVAVTSKIASGTALVGAFGTYGQVFNRSGIRVEASNSHSDFFIKNLIAIRAERRLALVIYRETAFGKVTGLN
jgi:HK97 family phage major capsid protein